MKNFLHSRTSRKIQFTAILKCFALFLLFFISGCANNYNTTVVVEKRSKLIVLLYDITKSYDSYAMLYPSHLEELYTKAAFDSGAEFYAFHVKANSQKQEAIEADILRFDTLELRGNAYQLNNRKVQNQKILAPFLTARNAFVNSIAKQLILPKNEGYTDLYSALDLAKITFNLPQFTNYDKYLIIISDGVNDLPNGINANHKAVSFENVKVILVRPTKTDYITGVQPVITNTISEAINNL